MRQVVHFILEKQTKSSIISNSDGYEEFIELLTKYPTEKAEVVNFINLFV